MVNPHKVWRAKKREVSGPRPRNLEVSRDGGPEPREVSLLSRGWIASRPLDIGGGFVLCVDSPHTLPTWALFGLKWGQKGLK